MFILINSIRSIIFIITILTFMKCCAAETLSNGNIENDFITISSQQQNNLNKTNNNNIPKSRRKRFLAFPEGSSFSV